MKFGEFLVKKGLVSREQLQQALDAQLIYGGHLGTCLIEKGWAREDEIGDALAEAFGMRYISKENLEQIPRYVIAKLPAKVTQKHLVVPFRLEGKKLSAAMIDPKNLQAIDEISFVAGCTLEAWIAPEARILQALERYYGIPRTTRYLSLCDMLDTEKLELQPASGHALTTGTGDGPTYAATTLSSSPVSTLAVQEALDPEPLNATADPLREVDDWLCGAESRESVAQVVLECASRWTERSVLFAVKEGMASLWQARGLGMDSVDAAAVRFEIAKEPLFGLPRGKSCYRGPVPNEIANTRFFRDLQIGPPREMLVTPVHLHDHLVTFFYGDGGLEGRVHGSTETHLRLMGKLALAMNLLSVKQKIRAS